MRVSIAELRELASILLSAVERQGVDSYPANRFYHQIGDDQWVALDGVMDTTPWFDAKRNPEKDNLLAALRESFGKFFDEMDRQIREIDTDNSFTQKDFVVGDLACDMEFLSRELSGELEAVPLSALKYADVLRGLVAHTLSLYPELERSTPSSSVTAANELVENLPGLDVDGYIGIAAAMSYSHLAERLTGGFDEIVSDFCARLDTPEALTQFARRLAEILGAERAISALNSRLAQASEPARGNRLIALSSLHRFLANQHLARAESYENGDTTPTTDSSGDCP